MKSQQKISYSFFAGILLYLFTISCGDNVVEEKLQTDVVKIAEIDMLCAKYSVIFEFNPDEVDKISISELENVLKSLSIQPKTLEHYSFEGNNIIFNSSLPKFED